MGSSVLKMLTLQLKLIRKVEVIKWLLLWIVLKQINSKEYV
ncbi:hypothetical protein MNBD_BACTEROID03-1325 [hydrothermal vent metagenome]|uniref:Uncharacterized protein n=1 Tax=hydrothermal vent metagenome TaxID=652676 RepID=A0A3B0TB44_9ZZZZ